MTLNPRSADTTPPHIKNFLESLINWSNKDTDFSTYLQETVKDPQETLTFLNTCNCCRRHALGRPKVLAVWTNTGFKGIHVQDTPCQCSCRHTARWICRAFKGDLDVQTGSTIEDDTQCAYIGLGENPPPNASLVS
jgi:hypothetical protein